MEKSSQNGANNNKTGVSVTQPKVFVLGDHAVVHVTETSGQHSAPDPNSTEPDAPPENSGEEEVVNKVSKFLQNDYLNKYGKVNRNPLKYGQTLLQDVFVNPDFTSVDNPCNSEENNRDLIYKIFETNSGSQSPSRVLIYGQAFMGKSILCQKYAYDWANPDFPSAKPFNQFKIVIFIKLSEVNGTLEEILERVVFRSRLTEDEKAKFFSFMKKYPHELLFLLDGVSECGASELADIKNFLLDQEYGGTYLIATIRPEPKYNCLKISKTFHSRYCIAGYGEASVLEYISKYFRHNETKREELKECLESNSDLMQLAQFPLVTLVLCELWNEQDKSLTITKLLSRYTDVVLKLFKLKSGEEIALQDVLANHEHLAVLGMTEDKTQFTQDELTNCKVDAKVGFLGTELNDDGSYKFAHEKLQQYFAARWIVENWGLKKAEELLNMMLLHSESRTYLSVLIFIAGLLAEKKDTHTLLQWFERLTKTTSETFFQDSCYCNRMDLFLASVAEAWNKDNSQAISSLCVGFEPFKKTKTPNGYPLVMSHGAAQGLGLVVRKLGLARLNLSRIVISYSEAKLIASKCLQQNSMLKSVKFNHSCLCSDAVHAVCVAFATMLRLEEVDLSCCNFGDKGLRAVADLIKQGGITSLQLGKHLDCNVEKEQVEHSKQQFNREDSSSKIEILSNFQEDCQNSPPSDESIKALITAIEAEVENENQLIQDISLPSSCVGVFINQWLHVFGLNTQLKRIKIHLKELSQNDDLVKFVNSMPKLEKMSVVLEVEESHRTEYSTHSSLEERTGGKIKLTIKDHTQSVKGPVNALSTSFHTR